MEVKVEVRKRNAILAMFVHNSIIYWCYIGISVEFRLWQVIWTLFTSFGVLADPVRKFRWGTKLRRVGAITPRWLLTTTILTTIIEIIVEIQENSRCVIPRLFMCFCATIPNLSLLLKTYYLCTSFYLTYA